MFIFNSILVRIIDIGVEVFLWVFGNYVCRGKIVNLILKVISSFKYSKSLKFSG